MSQAELTLNDTITIENYYPPDYPQSATLSGSLLINYDTLAVTGALSATAGAYSETYSNFSVNFTGSQYQLQSEGNVNGAGNPSQLTQSNDGLYLWFTGMQPKATDYLVFGVNGIYYDDFKADPIGSTEIPCYVSGTSICTTRGNIAVEHLTMDDVVVTFAGDHHPIRWLGHRTIDCRRHPRPTDVMPVRVTAHAFGENRPARDLLVSPGHSLCVDVVGEVLIPAMALINGTMITQESVDHVTYWHVELEGGHDILLAENMPAESYLDMGNRGFFAESGVVDLEASPDATVPTHADFCRPFHMDGALVEAVRAQLAVRAQRLGWRLEEQGLGDIHLIVDGTRVDPHVRGLSARFSVPTDARDVWLVSSTNVPAHIGDGSDRRELGVSIRGLAIGDGFGEPRVISAEDSRLSVGFYGLEGSGSESYRWTEGRASLPAELWGGVEGDFYLRVDLTRPALPRWVAPAAVPAREEAA